MICFNIAPPLPNPLPQGERGQYAEPAPSPLAGEGRGEGRGEGAAQL